MTARSSSSVSTAVSKGTRGMNLAALRTIDTFGHLAEPLYTTGPSSLSRRETDTPRERDFCARRTGAPCPRHQPGARKQSERARDRTRAVELPERLPGVLGHCETVDRQETRRQPRDLGGRREQDDPRAGSRGAECQPPRPRRGGVREGSDTA